MKLRLYSLAFFIIISVTEGFTQTWKSYPYLPEGSVISFPNDEGLHSEEPIEWWYTAGHLKGIDSGNNYSFMLTYFYFPTYGFDGFRILNLSNDDTGQFFNETIPVNYGKMAEDSLNIQAIITQNITESWINKTDNSGKMIPFEYSLSAIAENGEINLEFIALKPPLILGENGYFNQGENSYTYYYSLTKNSVSGTLTFDGNVETVTGTSWVDRQYGTFNPLTEENYEWFFIQLSNEMDLNIYNLFTKDRQLPDTSKYKHMSVYVDTTTQYTTYDFELERLSFHYMEDSARNYAQKWRLSSPVNNIDLTITTLHNNSEVQLPFRFFEGSTTITGTVDGLPVTGIGFAELLHSYENPDISITYPSGAKWTSAEALSWDLNNFDAGRPLKYDLEVSIDNKQTFSSIAQGLTDTLFYWDNPKIPTGSSCWFKVKAYSIDTTLQNTVITSKASIFDPDLITSLDISAGDKNDINYFNIYPNPAGRMLFLDLNNGHSYEYFRIMDVFGQIILQENVSDNRQFQFDLSNQATGIYIIGLFSQDAKVVSKFIKQ